MLSVEMEFKQSVFKVTRFFGCWKGVQVSQIFMYKLWYVSLKSSEQGRVFGLHSFTKTIKNICNTFAIQFVKDIKACLTSVYLPFKVSWMSWTMKICLANTQG